MLCSKKGKKRWGEEVRQAWSKLAVAGKRFTRQVEQVSKTFAFSFVEGVLVKALKEGHWILLDEINLAGADLLQRCVVHARCRFTGWCDLNDGA